MTAIALVIFTCFIVYVMIWSIKNENARSTKDQTGIIKMRDPKAVERSGPRWQDDGDATSRADGRTRD